MSCFTYNIIYISTKIKQHTQQIHRKIYITSASRICKKQTKKEYMADRNRYFLVFFASPIGYMLPTFQIERIWPKLDKLDVYKAL